MQFLQRRQFLGAALGAASLFLPGSASVAAGKSRRRDDGPVVDPHAHWFPEEWLKAVAVDGPAAGIRVTRMDTGWHLASERLTVDLSPVYFDLPTRLRTMDQQGVNIQALSLTTPMVHWAPPELGLKLARAFNDAASGAHTAHPDRFVGMATLPMQAPDLAVQEMDRARKLPGIRGICLPTNINLKELDDPTFHPVYAKCEEFAWPIFLHPVITIGSDRTRKFYLTNLLGNPYDTGVAASYLIFGGVLDKFPKLEIILPHAGGTLPGLIGRLDRGVEVRAELKHMKHPASSYLRRFTYDTIAHNDTILLNLIRQVGADRIVIGSDFPFDMGYERPVEVLERIRQLSTKDRDQILGGTAARLLKIQS